MKLLCFLSIISLNYRKEKWRNKNFFHQEATNGKITDIMPEKLKGPLNQPTNYLTDKNVSVESNFGDSRPLSISPFSPQPSSIPSRPTTGGQFDVRTSESHAAPRPLRSIRKLWLQC